VYKISVPLQELKAGMVLADPVQIINQHGTNVLTLPHSYVLTEKAIRAISLMKNALHGSVTIVSNRPPAKTQIAPDQPPQPIVVKQDNAPPKPPVPIISEAKKDEAIEGIRQLFALADDQHQPQGGNMTTAFYKLKELDMLLDELISIVTSEPKGLVHITGLRSFDEYTYHHSLSVSVLSMAIGHAIKLSMGEIKRLSRAAMLHDIGKMRVPLSIITKPAALTKTEFAIMKAHPEMGVKYLKSEFIGNQEMWEGILHHHERYNGTGYPKSLSGKDIPLFARIISVADVYDALTSYRPYREPMNPPSGAIEKIMSETGVSFDFEIVQAFVRKIEIYPLNSVVMLSDGRKGIVTGIKNPMRPTLKMFGTGEVVDLTSFDSLNLVIVESQSEPGLR